MRPEYLSVGPPDYTGPVLACDVDLVEVRLGDKLTFAVDVEGMYFCDPQTNLAIRS
jgi:hypothetical protein